MDTLNPQISNIELINKYGIIYNGDGPTTGILPWKSFVKRFEDHGILNYERLI
jgi:hypothetical protein